MPKRKANGEDKAPSKDKMDIDGEDSGSDDDTNIIDVDFEWFPFDSTIDFQGLKTLLRQLFDTDNQLFDLSALADLILSQPHIGSTVKTDGKESDPFSFLTVLNLRHHAGKEVIKQLNDYVLRVSKAQEKLHAKLQALLADNSNAEVGLILTERVINMPHQTVPPMYKFLLEEMKDAVEAQESFKFSHYLFISKTYVEVDSKLDAEDDPPKKKGKKGEKDEELFYFHPEDEILARSADGMVGGYDYEIKGDDGASDARRAFSEMGVKPRGHLVLIEASKMEATVKAIDEYLSDP